MRLRAAKSKSPTRGYMVTLAQDLFLTHCQMRRVVSRCLSLVNRRTTASTWHRKDPGHCSCDCNGRSDPPRSHRHCHVLLANAISSFLKLCKIKYYNYSPVYQVQPNFSFQSGDPLGPESNASDGGASIWSLPDGHTKKPTKRDRMVFRPEISKKRKHAERGTISMATTASKTNPDERLASSQFLITLADNIEDLDGKAAVFGEVVEGFDALERINTAFIDASGRPLQDIRILHTVVLDDPFDDPPGFVEPPGSPLPSAEQKASVRIAHDEVLEENADPEKLEALRREREARAQALTLELIGDLPFADVTPPEQILFVCKLNPVTRDEDLELIFSRYGKILSCEVVRDKKTGDSLQYAFIEFANKADCERAYFKMQGVLIDDHRIHVDFSQSVSKIAQDWRQNTNSKTARNRGGFGGIDSLERRRQYRGEDGGRGRGDRYDYVFEDRKRDRARDYDMESKRSRSRSPPRKDRLHGRRDRDEEHRDRDEPKQRRDADWDHARRRSKESGRRSGDGHDARRR